MAIETTATGDDEMGLDITAYRKLSRVEHPVMEGGEPANWNDEREFSASEIDRTEKNFPGRTAGLRPGVYKFAENYDFRAGSYGGYSAWRDELARYAGYPSANAIHMSPPDEGAFVELINFSDCQGYIGPVVAAKLAADFAEHQAQILAVATDSYFIERYLFWRKAFEMAADGGCVVFH